MDEHTGTKKGIKRAESLELPSRKKRASGKSKKVLKQDDQQTLRAPTTLPSEKLGALQSSVTQFEQGNLSLRIRNLMIHKLLILVILE